MRRLNVSYITINFRFVYIYMMPEKKPVYIWVYNKTFKCHVNMCKYYESHDDRTNTKCFKRFQQNIGLRYLAGFLKDLWDSS